MMLLCILTGGLLLLVLAAAHEAAAHTKPRVLTEADPIGIGSEQGAAVGARLYAA